jgi:hypothetical protein
MPAISFIIGFVTFLIVKSALPTLAQFEGDHINTDPNHSVAFIQDTERETGAQREAEALRLRFPVRCRAALKSRTRDLNRIFRTFGADKSRSLLLSIICTI